jgi:hypothetical protein
MHDLRSAVSEDFSAGRHQYSAFGLLRRSLIGIMRVIFVKLIMMPGCRRCW